MWVVSTATTSTWDVSSTESVTGNTVLVGIFDKEIEFLRDLDDAKICAARDSWAHLHRLAIEGKKQRDELRRPNIQHYVNVRCRGPPQCCYN